MERRLTAIMAADVVGYSRMMHEDEAATVAALHQLRKDILLPELSGHDGKVIKQSGDGWLIEFPSSTSAANCAIEIQRKLAGHPEIKLRVGLHIGDIVHDDDGDIYGDGVNIACRLEGIAKPGGIAISDQIRDLIEKSKRDAFLDSGRHQLKNIPNSIHIWHWPEALEAPVTAGAGRDADAVPVILIEKFAQGGDTENRSQTEFSDELRDELVYALARRSGIKVATDHGSNKRPTYILRGRCRVSGSRCRLYLSMMVAANGETFWSTKIDGDITDDTFDFLDRAVEKTDAALRTRINAFAGSEYVSAPNDSLSVQQLLSKAAYLFYQNDKLNSELARETMDAAYKKAPTNPMVLSMYAFAKMQSVTLAIEQANEIDTAAVLSLADKSVFLGSNIDVTFALRGLIRLWLSKDHTGCIADQMRALEINPNYHSAKRWAAEAKIFGDQREDGLRELDEVLSLVPEDPSNPVRHSYLAIGHVLAGNQDAAMKHATEGYDRKPLVRLHAIAYAAAAAGNTQITSSDRFLAMIEQHGVSTADADGFPFASESDTRLFAEKLRKAGVSEAK